MKLLIIFFNIIKYTIGLVILIPMSIIGISAIGYDDVIDLWKPYRYSNIKITEPK